MVSELIKVLEARLQRGCITLIKLINEGKFSLNQSAIVDETLFIRSIHGGYIAVNSQGVGLADEPIIEAIVYGGIESDRLHRIIYGVEDWIIDARRKEAEP